MKKALNALAALSCLGALSLVASASATGAIVALPRSLAGLSASKIVSLSLNSAITKGSCTNVSRGSAVGFTLGSSTDSGAHQAQQVVSFNKSEGRVLLVDGALYMKESAALLSGQFGKADSHYANRWILIPSANKSYQSVSSGLLFSSTITPVRPYGVLHASKIGTLLGLKVIAISGKANPEVGFTGGVETLFVATAAPYLPVRLVAGGRSQRVLTSLTVSFSNWGRKFAFAAPQGAVAISSNVLP